MVIGAFPVLKLGILAVRQIAKPLAEAIKTRAKTHPFFRKHICMPPAQLYNWMEVKTKMWALNLGKPVHVPPLNEAMAIELGASLLGEFIIFSIGALAIMLEYTRQVKKDAKKEEILKLEKAELLHRMSELSFRLEHQDAQLREMTRAFSDLESRSLFRWTQDRLREFQPFNPDTPDQSPARSSSSSSLPLSEKGVFMQAIDLLLNHNVEEIDNRIRRPEGGTVSQRDTTTENSRPPDMDEYDPISLEKQRQRITPQ